MKLERNHNIYQVIDKSIDEINEDLETIDFELGVLNFSQKMRTITASVITAAGAINTFLYVRDNQMSNCIFALIFIFLASRDIKKSKRNDLAIDILNEQKDLLNEAKEIKTKKVNKIEFLSCYFYTPISPLNFFNIHFLIKSTGIIDIDIKNIIINSLILIIVVPKILIPE